jgi:hypothetical protein
VRAAVVCGLAALLAACHGDGPTGIVVELSSDLAAPTEVDGFRLRVFDLAGHALKEVSVAPASLPARLSLVPDDPSSTSGVTVEAAALSGSTARITRQATVTFRRGSVLLLRLALDAACACVRCDPGTTCEEGRVCNAIVKDPNTLPVYQPHAQSGASGDATLPICHDDGGTMATDALAPSLGDGGVSMPQPVLDGAAGVDGGATALDARGPADGPDEARDAPVVNLPPDASPDQASPPPPPDVVSASPDLGVDRPLEKDAPANVPPDAATPADSAPPPPDLPAVRGNGAACSTNDQCQSRACVDGVCCQSACTGPCLACNHLATNAADGVCAPVLAGTDPDGDCAADTPTTCNYDGTCNGAGACRFYPATTQCGPPTCSGTTYAPARMCTGGGSCAPAAPVDCGFFLCTPSGCPQSCTSHAACASTAYCDGSTCLAQKGALAPCKDSRECRSGTCTVSLVCL